MRSLQLFFIALLYGLFIGCVADPCNHIECGPGNCIEGICDCPDGFSGVNCQIKDLNSGVECINGELINGACNCSVGYEGSSCEIESRDGFLGWWGCEQWTWMSQIGDSTFQGPSLGSIKFECGNSIPEIELFPTESSSGLMLLSPDKRIVGQVTDKTINFELQYLTTEISVYGSASFGDDLSLSIELIFFNSTTSITEVAIGTFNIFRHLKQCI